VGKIAKKQSEGLRFYSALKLQRHIVKNTLPQTAFSAILPTGQYKNNNSLEAVCQLL